MRNNVYVDAKVDLKDVGNDFWNVYARYYDEDGMVIDEHSWYEVHWKDLVKMLRAKLLANQRREEIRRGIRHDQNDPDQQLLLPGIDGENLPIP